MTSAGRGGLPDPAVSEKPVRRPFTARYKIRILREAELAPTDFFDAVSPDAARGNGGHSTYCELPTRRQVGCPLLVTFRPGISPP